ncbi:MAG: MAPEG family protein, partial [Emcibacteraceae bacterium]|nr:MAPEG family protein [Emcibacteraceae bacterium]
MPILEPFAITASLAGGLIILLVIASALVTERRVRLGGIEFGDAGDDRLRSRIRAHANLIEIAPMMLIGIALLEYSGASAVMLWWFAIIFFI